MLLGDNKEKVTHAPATQWDEIFRRDGRTFVEPAPVVVQFTKELRAGEYPRVLDLGCGSGRHILEMARMGLDVYGLDNSPAALSLAAQWLVEESQTALLVLADVCQPLPFRNNAFDALVSTQVIHHALLGTVQATAREIARVVRPGGKILVSVPSGKDACDDSVEVEPRTFVPLTGAEKGLPHHFFTPEELPKLFAPFRTEEVSVKGEVVIVFRGVKR
jgi:SAM-dependent methyltransferase